MAPARRGRPAGGRGSELLVIASFASSAVAGAGFGAAYWWDLGHQAIGLALGVALAAMALGLGRLAKHFLPGGERVGERHPLASTDDERAAFAAEFDQGERPVTRRRMLLASLASAVATLAAVLVLPIRSLGARPGRKPYVTQWYPGARLVTEHGRPVRAEDLEVSGVLTVFPEERLTTQARADSQVVLIRLGSAVQRLTGSRHDWAPGGFVAYSKVCTHAGCPVGLYESGTHQLVCPCHQSIFDVLDGARPVFGPATRRLPQLPLEMDDDGYLRARHDFTTPVGPGFWDLP